jgi:ATP-dependent Clp protease protease subunit
MKINIKGTIIPNDYKEFFNHLGIDSVCPQEVENIIDQAADKNIEVFVNSYGGSVYAGSEIYTLLRNYVGEVTIKITGIAASIASVIACAGYCEMSPAGMFMLHNVSGSADGDYNEMRKMAEILQESNKTIAAAYQDKTKKGESEILKMMNSETWLSAERAVELGFVDKIIEQKNRPILAASMAWLPDPETVEKFNQKRIDKNFGQAKLELEYLKMKGD